MPASERVARWVSQNYPQPTIDPAWLSDCSDWVSTTYNISPSTHFHDFIVHVEEQLLQSNLEDSTVPGTGLDRRLVQTEDRPSRKPSLRANRRVQSQRRKKVDTGSIPLLVEIRSITEIAHSAFGLLNTHQTRLDRADLGLARDGDNQQDQRQQDEDEGPIPRFPRGMLRFELSDGHTLFRAIEFRSIPDLVLGETPLGYKMQLISTPIRNGVAFLQPSNVVLKGYQTEDHDIHRDEVFLSGLRKRMGRPDPQPEGHAQQRVQPQLAQAAPLIPPQPRAAPPRQHQPTRVPSPPTDFDDMYVDDDINPEVLDVLAQMETNAVGTTPLSGRTLTGSGATTQPTVRSGPNTEVHKPLTTVQQQKSSYFLSSAEQKAASPSVPDIGLSLVRAPLSRQDDGFDITWDSDESEAFRTYANHPTHTTVKGTSPSEPHSAVASSHKDTAMLHSGGNNFVPSRGTELKRRSSTSARTSIDPFDSFSMDLDVDDNFLAEVEKAEQQALAPASNKGKATRSLFSSTQPSYNVSLQSSQQNPSGSTSVLTMSTGKRLRSMSDAASPSSQRQIEPCPPPSTQPPHPSFSNRAGSLSQPPPPQSKRTGRQLTRDPTVIVISSSDSEMEQPVGAEDLPQRERQIKVERRGDSGDREMLDVISISD